MRLTKRVTVLAAATFLLIVAAMLNISQLFWMAGMLLAFPMVGGWIARGQLRGLTARRASPPSGQAGDRLTFEVEVRNNTSFPRLNLSISEQLPRFLVPLCGPEIPLHLAPRGSVRVRYDVRLEKRGVYRLPPPRLLSADPLGLSIAVRPFGEGTELVVFPSVMTLPPAPLRAGEMGRQSQHSTARRRGDGYVPFGVREYRSGDPMRNIHWRSSARLQRLSVVEYEEERSSDLLIALETREGTEVGSGEHTTLEYGVMLAASLAAAALQQGDRVRLLAPGWREWQDEPDPHPLPGILDVLARLQANSPQSVEDALAGLLPQISGRCSVVLITARAGEGMLELAQRLGRAGIPLTVLGLDSGSFNPRAAGSRANRGMEDGMTPGANGKRNTSGRGEAAWQRMHAELQGAGVPTVVIRRGDDLTTRLEEAWRGTHR